MTPGQRNAGAATLLLASGLLLAPRAEAQAGGALDLDKLRRELERQAERQIRLLAD